MNKKIEQLNAECFRYDNYESNWWYLLDLDYEQSMEYILLKEKVKEYAIGYCDGLKLSIRPRESIAVMFEKDGTQFWFHIYDEELQNEIKG